MITNTVYVNGRRRQYDSVVVSDYTHSHILNYASVSLVLRLLPELSLRICGRPVTSSVSDCTPITLLTGSSQAPRCRHMLLVYTPLAAEGGV